MSLDDELRRVLDDKRLSLPVRPGSEWSLVAAARRRRYRAGALAVTGGVLAALTVVGGAVGLVAHEPDPAPGPAGPPPVVVSSTPPGEPAPQQPQPPRTRPAPPVQDHQQQRVVPDREPPRATPEPTRDLPSILREPGSPLTSGVEPTDPGRPPSTSAEHPTSEPSMFKPAAGAPRR